MNRLVVAGISILAVGLLILGSQANVVGYQTVLTLQQTTIEGFTLNHAEDSTVPITILEYKPDGTISKAVVKLSQEQAKRFHKELNSTKDWDARLSVYKKYRLIPPNVSAETLYSGMTEKVQRAGLTDGRLNAISTNAKIKMPYYSYLLANILCKVFGVTMGFSFYLGSSAILSRWNYFASIVGIDLLLPSVDYASAGLGVCMIGAVNGLLEDAFRIWIIGYNIIGGFVGYVVQKSPTPLREVDFIGYCGFVVSGGIPVYIP